ncbi:MEMO1 family protein [Nitrospira sp.]|nr:MEMO1 family protein [Nitrospira sp.]
MTSTAPTTSEIPTNPVLRNLQYSPIKEQDEQYMVLWDPSGLSSEKLILPLNYFFIIQHLDGQHSLEQIGALYLRRFGEFLMPDNLRRLLSELEGKLFLEGPKVEAIRAQRQAAYRQAPLRPAVFAGKSYESDGFRLRRQLEGFYASNEGPDQKPSLNRGKRIKGLVAPAYDVKQSGPIYAWAYKELNQAESPDVYVLLGTCHAGMDSLFAVTDRDFQTPLGVVPVHQGLAEAVRSAGADWFRDDLAHQQEHCLEFQMPFLQDAVGSQKKFSMLPILCNFSALSLHEPDVRGEIDRFVDALKGACEAVGVAPCFIASGDLGHIGMRYGDSAPPTDFSFHRCMQNDLAMLKYVEELKPEDFSQFIQTENDSRRISGFAPMYTLLRLMSAERGEVLRYDRGITDQFNSTVTYASIVFF